MIVKDYYKILDVKPSAATGEIKKNYRRLAMKYHPDKNQGDALAAAVFSEIAEAYGVLSDPGKRQDYNYKRAEVYGGAYTRRAEITRESVENDIAGLQKTVALADPYRINRDALYFSILQILAEGNVLFLQQEKNTSYKRHVIAQLLLCSKPLTQGYIKKVTDILLVIAGDDEQAQNTIHAFVQSTRRDSKWNSYKVVIAIVAALILCLLIFLLSKQ